MAAERRSFGRRESMTTRPELRRDLDAVVRPRRMAVASALAMPDRNRALPDDVLDVILSDEFEQWKREFLPEPLNLSDKMRDHIFE